MTIIIKNRAKHLLILALDTKNVHLAPGELSPPIEEFEINGNDRVTKLLKTKLIATTTVVPEEALKEVVPKDTSKKETEQKQKRARKK